METSNVHRPQPASALAVRTAKRRARDAWQAAVAAKTRGAKAAEILGLEAEGRAARDARYEVRDVTKPHHRTKGRAE